MNALDRLIFLACILGFLISCDGPSSNNDNSNRGYMHPLGPGRIVGWKLNNVRGDGACFYHAIIHQMKLQRMNKELGALEGMLTNEIKPGYSSNIEGSLYAALRKQIVGEHYVYKNNYPLAEWAEDNEMKKFAELYPNVALLIVNTLTPQHGYYQLYFQNKDNVVHTTYQGENSLSVDGMELDGDEATKLTSLHELVKNKKYIVRIAYTGNHYMSVVYNPQLKTGLFRDEYLAPGYTKPGAADNPISGS